MKVSVYFNLHKRVFSVLAMEGPAKGRVIAHAEKVGLQDVTQKVQEGGRQRVIKEGKKNVHAFINGDLVAIDGRLTETGLAHHGEDSEDPVRVLPLVGSGRSQSEWERIKYNPFRYDRFVHHDTADSFVYAEAAFLSEQGVEVHHGAFIVDGPRELQEAV